MSPETTRKRFIAGAVCPACGEQDKVMMWEEDGMPHRECMACGYADSLDALGRSMPRELTTRVNQTAPKLVRPEVRSVRFFPNPKLKRPDS